jgi:hypothetical protein
MAADVPVPAGEGKVYAVLPTALTGLVREVARDD